MFKAALSILIVFLSSSAVHAQSYNIVGQASTFNMSYSDDYSQPQIDVMNEAATYWANLVHSDVPIEVTVGIVNRYYCSFGDNAFVLTSVPDSAVNFENAPQANVSYPITLANAYAGYDLLPNQPDIEIRYNWRNVDGIGRCRSFYLGKDNNFEQFKHISLYWETIQEIAHGLGLFPLTDFKTGARANNAPDIYTSFIRSVKHGKMVHALTTSELYDAATSFKSITFNGPNAVAYGQENLTAGLVENGLLLYSTVYYNRGTIAAHFTSSLGTLTSLSIPFTNEALPDEGITFAMLKDIGWQIGLNQAPNITGQQPMSTNEDELVTLALADLVISDEQPENLTLEIAAGNNYQVNGLSVSPVPNFFGQLDVKVRVNDGEFNSEWFTVSIEVKSVNDAPVITGQSAVSTLEEQAITLTPNMLNITDVDSNAFTIQVLNGSNYRVEGTTITPAVNFSGTLSVPVQVFDGSDVSAIFNVDVTVQATNDAPVIDSQNILQWQEDSQPSIATNWVNFTDVDSNQFSLLVLPGDHYSVAGNTLSLEKNYNGTLTIGVKVFDGLDYSDVFYVTANVLPVNDAPTLAAIAAQEIFEDNSFFITEALLQVSDPDNDTFTLSIVQGDNYQIAGQEVIPSANWFGELLISISVSDGELSSQTQILKINVLAVNDLPELSTAELNQVAIYRNHSEQLSATDVDSNELSFSLENAPQWVSVSSTGLLSVYAGYQAVGDWPLTIKVSDGFGTVSEQRILRIIDDPTATDLTVEANVDRTIWGLNAWVPVEIFVQNKGPMSEVSAPLTINFEGEWQSQDARCQVSNNQCNLTVTDASRVELLIKQTTAASLNFNVSFIHDGYEINDQNNQATLALTFTDAPITSPQFTVPSFGQGNVRAIALANIQGGRWPEVMFANGPTEASTAYRFEKSLFRPVLHSHLADASNSYAMAIADINNDGHKDWVLANGNGEANTVYLNKGDGQFKLHSVLGNKDSRAVTYADMDRDGDVDLLFANNEDNNTLYFNDGAGNFTLAAEFPARRSRGVIVFDFNGDGKLDILFANHGHRNRIFFNRGRGAVILGRSLERASESSVLDFNEVSFGDPEDLTSHVSLADLDGDGIASDVVLVNEGTATTQPKLQIVAVNSDQNPTLVQEKATSEVSDISVGDYDGDGIDDIAVLHQGGALEVMSSQLDVVEVMETQGADSILLVDVDGSGTADVISANSRQGESRLDFTGNVTNSEDSTASATSKPLLNQAQNTRPSAAVKSSKSGTLGGFGLLMGLLLLLKRRSL